MDLVYLYTVHGRLCLDTPLFNLNVPTWVAGVLIAIAAGLWAIKSYKSKRVASPYYKEWKDNSSWDSALTDTTDIWNTSEY